MSSSTNTINLGTVFKGSKSGKIVKAEGAERAVRPTDVVIAISHSGLCGTDLHMRRSDMVLGHEGVGIVSQVGGEVTRFKKGDRVGWGYNHNSCNHCKFCASGWDTLCNENAMYGQKDLDQGSFGDTFVVNHDFCYHIPEGLSLRDAAPLQCGGATVFGAMRHAGITSVHRAGVIGVGGLGHLAIAMLSKMGVETVVFSGTESKKDEALKLGASEFVAAKTNPKLEGVKPVDFLFVATSAQPDWETYVKVVEKNGTIVPLSVDMGPMKNMPYMPIVGKQLRIMGSLVAPRNVHREMLEFCARTGVKPMVEELSMTEEGLNTALERLEKGDVRYRFVLASQKNSGSANL